MNDDDHKWIDTRTGDLPCDNRAVAVLVAWRDGSFKPDIGRYYGKDGWNVLFWKEAAVTSWMNLPSFVDDTEVIEVDDAA